MKLDYIPEKNTCVIDINGQTEEITLDKLLDMLPERLVRDKWIINEIMKNRTAVVKQIGGFNEYIVDLTHKINTINAKIQSLDPEADIKTLKFYTAMISGLKAEKDVVRELRHGIRASHSEEGRLANELAQLENVRG